VDLILVQRTKRRYFDRFEGLLQDLYRAIPGREIECFVYTPKSLPRFRTGLLSGEL